MSSGDVMESLQSFFTILIPLVIITDPFGNLPLFLLFTSNLTDKGQNRAALHTSIAACGILVFFSLTGSVVLQFFGISLPAFQLAGGFIFFLYALQMLQLIPSGIKTTQAEEQDGMERENAALVPLATPLIAGPGAITAVLVWQQGAQGGQDRALLIGAIITACLILYLVFYFGKWLHHILGVSGIKVVTRLMGLLLAVIAVQFMVDGLLDIVQK